MTARCCICERPFTRRAKPCWAFDKKGRTRGRAHSSHRIQTSLLRNQGLGFIAYPDQQEEDARQVYWLWHLRGRSEDPEDWRASTLFITPAEEVEERLGWWRNGPLGMTDLQIAVTRNRAAVIGRNYAAWRASL